MGLVFEVVLCCVALFWLVYRLRLIESRLRKWVRIRRLVYQGRRINAVRVESSRRRAELCFQPAGAHVYGCESQVAMRRHNATGRSPCEQFAERSRSPAGKLRQLLDVAGCSATVGHRLGPLQRTRSSHTDGGCLAHDCLGANSTITPSAHTGRADALLRNDGRPQSALCTMHSAFCLMLSASHCPAVGDRKSVV